MPKLGIIALSALAVSAICLGAAAAIGARHGGGEVFDFSMFDGMGGCEKTGATAESLELAWDGGDSVTVEVPATLHYKRGVGDKVQVKGDPQLLAHLRIHDGTIEMNCHIHGWHHRRLDITLPGREFRQYRIEGMGDVDLQDIDQTALKLEIAGSGDITASGKTDDLDLRIAGRGDAKLKDLMARNVKIEIAGRGDVETSPLDDADIDVAGSGNVKLYTEPKHLNTSIMGSGNVDHLAGKS